jgi:uncharacterized membrane protein
VKKNGLISRLRNFLANRSGNIATLAALTLPIGLAAAALAVDEGSLYVERREAQSLTDLAAIYGAANIGKAETAVLAAFGDNHNADVVLTNGLLPSAVLQNPKRVTVEKGRYTLNLAVDPTARFVAGATPENAVKVTYRKEGAAYFGAALMGEREIITTAVATAPAEAAFSVGSRLASLNNGIINDLLTGLIGTNVSLDVMDYNALLAADVNVLQFLDTLATNLNLTAGTYENVLASQVTIGQIATALAGVNNNSAADVALAKLFGATGAAAVKVPLSQLIDLGQVGKLALGSGAAGFDADIGLLEMLTTAAAIANKSKQVTLNLSQGLGGLTSIKLDVAIGEPPQGSGWFGIGETGKIIRTAQTRLKLEATVGTGGLLGGKLGATIKVPLYVEIAYAEAQLKNISCPTGQPSSAVVTLAARPGIADVYLGVVDPTGFKVFTSRPTVAAAPLVNVTTLGILNITVAGSAHVEIGNLTPVNKTFNKNDIDNGVIKNVSTRDITQSLTSSLLGNLQLQVGINLLGLLPLGLIVPTEAAVKTAVISILSGVTAPIDTLLYNVLTTLGVRVGEADLRVHGVSCGRSVLVL